MASPLFFLSAALCILAAPLVATTNMTQDCSIIGTCVNFQCGSTDIFSPVLVGSSQVPKQSYGYLAYSGCSTFGNRVAATLSISLTTSASMGIAFMSMEEGIRFSKGECTVSSSTGAISGCGVSPISVSSGIVSISGITAPFDAFVIVFYNYQTVPIQRPSTIRVIASSTSSDIHTFSSVEATCFPATAHVSLANGSTTTMAQLKVGDAVQVLTTSASPTASSKFSDVFMFSHHFPMAVNTFVQLTTRAGSSITLSHGHYLYVNGALATARSVKVGDLLEMDNGATTPVVATATVMETGLYNAHTMHGDIVVNGIRASTYTEAIHPTLAHSLLAPARALYAMKALPAPLAQIDAVAE